MSFNSKKFQYFLDAIQNEYKDKIIAAGISNSRGNEIAVYAIINLGDEVQFYPTFDDDFNMRISSINGHSVLTISINLDGVAYFGLRGNILDGEYNEHGDGPEVETECFELKVRNFKELKETIDFFREVSINKSFKTVSNYIFKELAVSDLAVFDYVFIPTISNEFLLPLELLGENQILEGIEDILNQKSNPHRYIPYSEKPKPSLFFAKGDEIQMEAEKQIKLKQQEIDELIRNNKLTNKITHKDLFIRKNHNYPYLFSYDYFLDSENLYGANRSDEQGGHQASLYYVLSLKPDTSYIAIYDFLDKTIEGFSFREEFIKNNKLPIKVEYIENKFAQVQYALEDRINRTLIQLAIEAYLTSVQKLTLKNSLTKQTLRNLRS